MNRFLERSLRRGVAAPAVGTALSVELLPEALSEEGTPLLPSPGTIIISTRHEHPVPALFAAVQSVLPAGYLFLYPKGAFSESGLEEPALERVCLTSGSVTGC